jgi:hypothetical protein
MDEEPGQIAATNKDFEVMETAARLKFDAAARSAIVKLLRDFELHCRLEAGVKQRAKLAADMTKLGKKVQRIKQKHGQIWLKSAAGDSELSARVRAAEQFQEPPTRFKQAPKYIRVWKLLVGLEEVFKKAGGESTGIHRSEREARGGPFPEFAKAAVRCLPKSIRPRGITSTWEEIYSGRKRGRAQMIGISLAHGFSLTFTSRRPRRR